MLTDKSKFQPLKLRSSQASRFPKNQESVLRSSFIVLPRSSPDGPWINNHQFKIKPRRPSKKVFFVLHSSFFQDQAPTALYTNNHPPIQDQAPTALRSTSHRSSRSSLKALEDPFIAVLQDQAQKPLKIRSSPFAQIHLQRSSPRPLKKLPTVHPKSSLHGPWINKISINQHLTEIESDDQDREIEKFVFTNWHAQWDNLYLSSLSPFKKFEHTSKINGIKEGSNCSRNWRKEQERPHRKWCHFRHHDSKQGKSYFYRLFHLCINSAKGTRAPKA
ncbi:hypothetical protein ACFX2B_024434 [Malus domestica]